MLTSRFGAQSHSQAISKRLFSSSHSSNADFTHAVIGGGVVGLAIARQLAARSEPTILIEKHGAVGTETSSRNSEVIHAGLYYGHDTLKTRLCLRGKSLLYSLCEAQGIPHRNTGKWIVAQDDQQMSEVSKVHNFAQSINVPTRFLSRNEIQQREPDVRAEGGVLESPTTGIVDSHALMTYLSGSISDHGGDLAFNTTVSSIRPLTTSLSASTPGSGGWELTTHPTDGSSSVTESTTITATHFINAAGLHAIPLSNSLLPPSRQLTPHYAKGTYYSYNASLPHGPPRTLLYPAPVPGLGGLGTHLTLDMAGRMRFGPDIEWLAPEYPASAQALTPNPDPERRRLAIAMIREYLPAVDEDALSLDYCGIRPKLGRIGVAEGDFWIKNEHGFQGWVNLLGIESPGLTASLAIAEEVERLIYGNA